MSLLSPVFVGAPLQSLDFVMGVVVAAISLVIVLGIVGLALSPIWSNRWAEQFGVAESPSGPDPAEVVPGAGGLDAGGDGVADASESTTAAADAEEPTPIAAEE